jgi:hypothetical protein
MPPSFSEINPWRQGAAHSADPANIFLRHWHLRDHGITYSRQHLAVLERQGRFPRRYRLSERVIAWRLSEILEWLASRRRE